MNAWLFLLLGIVFEVIGTTALKLSDGFSVVWASALCIICFSVAMFCLSISVKQIDIGIVYAIWSGVGISIITVFGVLFFQESLSIAKVAFIGLIVVGVVGLQTQASAQSASPAPVSDDATNRP